MGDRDELVERVEGPGVHVAGLGAHDDRAVDPRERVAQRVGAHPTLVVGGDLADPVALATHPQHLERGVDRDVRAAVGDDRDRRRALSPRRSDVPARACEDAVAAAAARAVKLAIVAPVTNPTLVSGGEAEQLDEPAAATSSATAAAGEMAYSPAFWSQALASQSAPRAAGRLPPMTNPK